MIIVAVWNPKGGQGKTTCSLNLAAAGSKLGLKVLVVSRDVQDDDLQDLVSGTYKFKIASKMPNEKPDADLVIVDHPAQDFNPPEAHRVVCPIVPCKVDYKVYAKAKPILEEAGKEIIEVVNKGDMRIKNEREFMILMRKRGASAITQRSIFSNAHNENKTIFDSSYNKTSKIGEPRAQVEGLLARILA